MAWTDKGRRKEASEDLLSSVQNFSRYERAFAGDWHGGRNAPPWVGPLEAGFYKSAGYPPPGMFGIEGALRAGADVDTVDKFGNTPLIHAIANQAPGLAAYLIDKWGADLNKANNYGDTPLMLAAAGDDAALVRKLLLSKADIAHKNDKQETAADIAAKNASPAIAELLPFLKGEQPVAALAAVEKKKKLDSDVIAAASHGYAPGVRTALAAGGDANATDQKGYTALMQAYSAEAAQALIDAGADVNAAKPDGTTALTLAAENSRLQMVETLLKAGADPLLPGKDGRTALDYALDRNDRKIAALVEAEILRRSNNDPQVAQGIAKKKAARAVFSAIRDNEPLELAAALKDANPAAHGPDGTSAMTYAILKGGPSAAAVLLAAGVSPDTPDSNGLAPLFAALQAGKPRTFSALLSMGANADIKDKDGRTLLSAVFNSRAGWECLEPLLKSNIDVNAPDKDGQTLIQFCVAQGGFADHIVKLAKAGAKLDVQDKDGNTPLMTALKEGKGATAEALLDAGADVTVKNAKGETAYEIAKNSQMSNYCRRIKEKEDAAKDTRIEALEKQVSQLSREIARRDGNFPDRGGGQLHSGPKTP